jgi:hypothetical protein
MRIASLLFLAACNAPPTIHASAFDQTCTQASDCMLIDEGSSCCSQCGNASDASNDAASD